MGEVNRGPPGGPRGRPVAGEGPGRGRGGGGKGAGVPRRSQEGFSAGSAASVAEDRDKTGQGWPRAGENPGIAGEDPGSAGGNPGSAGENPGSAGEDVPRVGEDCGKFCADAWAPEIGSTPRSGRGPIARGRCPRCGYRPFPYHSPLPCPTPKESGHPETGARPLRGRGKHGAMTTGGVAPGYCAMAASRREAGPGKEEGPGDSGALPSFAIWPFALWLFVLWPFARYRFSTGTYGASWGPMYRAVGR